MDPHPDSSSPDTPRLTTPPANSRDAGADPAAHPPTDTTRTAHRWPRIAVAAIAALALVGACFAAARWGAGLASDDEDAGSDAAATGPCDAVAVARDTLPAVVTIDVKGPGTSGNGSGEVIRKDGHILTNDHVIASAATTGTISVTFANGETAPAELVGRDPRSDLAVLKVAPQRPLPVIDLGDSGGLVVGQPVVALGAPLGLSSSVTAGIVSALGRNVAAPAPQGTTTLVDSIQTDAAINPGNSGGALVNCRGQLIGVNTAISTVPNAQGIAGGGSVGIGFAVPVNWAMRIADELIASGRVTYAWFGAETTPIPPALAERWDIEGGLFVQSVTPGGSAAAGGLQPGDVIVAADGRPTHRNEALSTLMLTKKAGDSVDLDYVREATARTLALTLVGQPQ